MVLFFNQFKTLVFYADKALQSTPARVLNST